jgi:hypothetical protein
MADHPENTMRPGNLKQSPKKYQFPAILNKFTSKKVNWQSCDFVLNNRVGDEGGRHEHRRKITASKTKPKQTIKTCFPNDNI